MKFFIFLCCTVLLGELSWATANIGAQKSFRTYRVGATTQNYSGTDKLSFSQGSPSYGVEATVDTGANYLRYFLRGRYNVASGSQNFIKNGTTYFSKYDFSSFEAELGLSYYPFSRRDKGLNIYVWGAGNLSYNGLSLSTVPSGLNISKNETETGTGYGAGLGVEYLLSGARGAHVNTPWIIYADVGYRDLRAPLAGQDTFEITSLSFAVGLGF